MNRKQARALLMLLAPIVGLALALAATVTPVAAAEPGAAGSATLAGIKRNAAPAVPAFGITAHLTWHDTAQTLAELDRIQAAGFTVVRFDVNWSSFEPNAKGAYDQPALLYLDRILREMAARQLTPIVTVLSTPAWARPADSDVFTPPTNPQDYADFVRMLAARYAARPALTWEVWNEPNLIQFWATGPDAAQYATLLRLAYGAIKAVAPQATVLGGSIAFNDRAFLDGMYAAGAAGTFDGLAIHPYTGGLAPTDNSDPWFSLQQQVEQLHGAMADRGDGAKRLYITEFGWSTDDVSDATRATYFRDAVALLRRYSYVAAACAYTINAADYPSYGLVTPAGVETTSWRAYADAAK